MGTLRMNEVPVLRGMQLFLLCVLFATAFASQLALHALDRSLSSSLALASLSDIPPPLNWFLVPLNGTRPTKRSGHSATVVESSVFVFGGCFLDTTCYNDAYMFDASRLSWTPVAFPGDIPTPRSGHSATLVGTSIFLYGGVASEGYLKDVYELDLEQGVWGKVERKGNVPPARANHAADVDDEGRIIVFGGFAESGNMNDVYYFPTDTKTWIKPFVGGSAPPAREGHSGTMVFGRFWVFGGYCEGGLLNDLWVLDVDTSSWMQPQVQGTVPSPRQDHSATRLGKLIFIVGGCNFRIGQCFSDTYIFNTETLFWSTLLSPGSVLKVRSGHTTSFIAGDLFLFGGCYLQNECYNDVVVMDSGEPCPIECNHRGECRNEMCVCDPGWTGNDCSSPVHCPLDCSARGQCHNNGKCACYPGYTGTACDIEVNCPGNCTGHGICQTNSDCICNLGFRGLDCTVGFPQCINNCSDHGICQDDSTCRCSQGWMGNDCSQKKPCMNYCNGHGTCDEHSVCVCDIGWMGLDCGMYMPNAAQFNESLQAILAARKEEEDAQMQKDAAEKADKIADAVVDAAVQAKLAHKLQEAEQMMQKALEIQQQAMDAKAQAESDLNKARELLKLAQTQNLTSSMLPMNITGQFQNFSFNSSGLNSSGLNMSALNVSAANGSTTTANLSVTLHDSELANASLKGLDGLNDTNISSSEVPLTTPAEEVESTAVASAASPSPTPAPEVIRYKIKSHSFNREEFVDSPKKNNLANCPNRCSHHGICEKETCFCEPGFVGEDCSISRWKDLNSGVTYMGAFKASAISFSVGIVTMVLLFVYAERKRRQKETSAPGGWGHD